MVALPSLTADVLLNPDVLDSLIAQVIDVSTPAGHVQAEIGRELEALEQLLEPTAFAAVRRVVELHLIKMGIVLPLLVSWSWAEGVLQRRDELH